MSKSIIATGKLSRNTQLYGAKSLWQITSMGRSSGGVSCQPVAELEAKEAVAS